MPGVVTSWAPTVMDRFAGSSQRIRVITCAAVLVSLVATGCADDGPSENTIAIEAKYGVIADIEPELSTGTRTMWCRRDSEKGFLSYYTGSCRLQGLEPNEGASLADLEDEVISISEAAGWTMAEGRPGWWCATSGMQSDDTSFLVRTVQDPTGDDPPRVYVHLESHCS